MRQPQITRTIITTKAKVLCVNTEKETTENIEVIIPRTYKDDKAMLKAVEKAITDTNVKPVHITGSEVVETLYGMSEQEFISYSKVLPTRGIAEDKANNTDNK